MMKAPQTKMLTVYHCFLVFLFLADQIFYTSYINRQHFRLRSFASLWNCFVPYTDLYFKTFNTY